jgi:hypothetical protein
VPLRYPCIICSCFEHRAPNCPRKAKVQNMFRTKPKIIFIVATKSPIPNNVPINVIPTITTCSQGLKQQVFKKQKLVKAKTTTNW